MLVDEKYMMRCIQLAKLGVGATKSNPMVGAILVYNGTIIGEGYHQKYGEAHAEINCLKSVKEKDKEHIPHATLYVSLEPCNHMGKTPPCSTAIVEAGIKKVVIGTQDLNPIVKNKGIEFLKSKGIQIRIGVCEAACYHLNKVFFTNHSKARTFIKLKWAQSSNGLIGDSSKELSISSKNSNILNHKYRSEVDGILVGYNTAQIDKPQLNVRHWNGKQPARIFIDWDCTLPTDIIYKEGFDNIILTENPKTSTENILYIQVAKSANSIAEALLANNINSIIVEGGASTHELFINKGIWDEAVVITNQKDLQTDKGVRAPTLKEGQFIGRQYVSDDIIEHYSNSSFIK